MQVSLRGGFQKKVSVSIGSGNDAAERLIFAPFVTKDYSASD